MGLPGGKRAIQKKGTRRRKTDEYFQNEGARAGGFFCQGGQVFSPRSIRRVSLSWGFPSGRQGQRAVDLKNLGVILVSGYASDCSAGSSRGFRNYGHEN